MNMNIYVYINSLVRRTFVRRTALWRHPITQTGIIKWHIQFVGFSSQDLDNLLTGM